MASELICIVCCEPYFGTREPMCLPCGHTVCKICIARMVEENYQVACPYDRSTISDLRVINELKPNISVKSAIDNIETRCTEHQKAADSFCMSHLEPLCDQCTCNHQGCAMKRAVEESGDISLELVLRIRDLSRVLSLPPTLTSQVNSIANFPLRDKLMVYRKLIKYRNGDFSDDPRAPAISKIQKDLKSIHSPFLSFENLQQIFSLPVDTKQCADFALRLNKLVGIPLKDESDLPDYFACMKCFQWFSKNDSNMLVLPCYEVYHLVCMPCASSMADSGTVVCGLDGRTFNITSIDRMKKFDILPPLENGNRLLPPTPGLHFVDLFRHTQPHLSMLSSKNQGNFRGYTVDKSGNQVEAVTFMRFSDATLKGLSITNPVDNGVTLSVEWVKIYSGEFAKRNPTLTTTVRPNLLVGGNVLQTDLMLSEGFHISAIAQYSLKLKLRRTDTLGGDVMMYRGNHLTRVVNYEDTAGSSWEFSETKGFDEGERCLGQHFLSGPIVRLLFEG